MSPLIIEVFVEDRGVEDASGIVIVRPFAFHVIINGVSIVACCLAFSRFDHCPNGVELVAGQVGNESVTDTNFLHSPPVSRRGCLLFSTLKYIAVVIFVLVLHQPQLPVDTVLEADLGNRIEINAPILCHDRQLTVEAARITPVQSQTLSPYPQTLD